MLLLGTLKLRLEVLEKAGEMRSFLGNFVEGQNVRAAFPPGADWCTGVAFHQAIGTPRGRRAPIPRTTHAHTRTASLRISTQPSIFNRQ